MTPETIIKYQFGREQRLQKPKWLKRTLPKGPDYENLKAVLERGNLHSVCEEARCPNIWECFSRGTATFLIMGNRCTRNCRFCGVAKGVTTPPDLKEPARVAETVRYMKLEYVVVTSVTRDDLPDGGAFLFAETIQEIRSQNPDTLVEVLIPDFQGNLGALLTVLNARPNVLAHNMETVPRLYPLARPKALYEKSILLLKRAKHYAPEIPLKSGIMLGLGEYPSEIFQSLLDLHEAGCSMVTLGQYLQPSSQHLPVRRYVSPEEFNSWRDIAFKIGFSQVASGPFVRSSYRAKEFYEAVKV